MYVKKSKTNVKWIIFSYIISFRGKKSYVHSHNSFPLLTTCPNNEHGNESTIGIRWGNRGQEKREEI